MEKIPYSLKYNLENYVIGFKRRTRKQKQREREREREREMERTVAITKGYPFSGKHCLGFPLSY
jgi:hypothetical protein